MRRIACFIGTVFNVCLMAILFSSLLIASNLVISKSFASTEPTYCNDLTQLTCQGESYSSRKRAIFEYSGRCLRKEMGKNPGNESSLKFEENYASYIFSLENKVAGNDRRAVESFFESVKRNLLTSIQNEKKLTEAKKKEYAGRVLKVTLLWPSDHVRVGGSREFRNTCGELGLEENASYAVFASGESHVVICPGRLIAALKNPDECGKPKLDTQSLLYTLSHELGHAVGGNFVEYDSKVEAWITKNDPTFGEFRTCMKGKYSEYPQKDYGEATADYWASQSMALYFQNHPNERKTAIQKTLAGLCGTTLTSRHLPGDVRIRDLIGTQGNLRASLGCNENVQSSEKICRL